MRHLLFSALAACSLLAAPPMWQSDLSVARHQAMKTRTPVLLLFTGSEWCSYCIQLEKEVLSTPAFAAWAEKAILVKLDYPAKTERSPEKLAANKALADLVALKEAYKVPGFPTAIWLDANGQELARAISYKKGTGPKAYLTQFPMPKAK